jgi:hypothetical protein
MLSNLQIFGYTIALLGMLYYKTSPDQRKELIGTVTRSWGEFGATRPALRKIVVGGMVITTLFFLLSGLAPGYDPKSLANAAKTAIGQ